MPWWSPGELWKGQDAYVVGGGDSLRTFNWGSIEGKRTIGCNGAFVVGAKAIEIVLFCDIGWWSEIGKKRLPEFGGTVVACCPQLERVPTPDWLLLMERWPDICYLAPPGSGKLGWFGHTGASAINLALALGARRVYLLGFDMHLNRATGKPNFHDVRHEPGKPEVYYRFVRSFVSFQQNMAKLYPDREIVNVTDDSSLNTFPKISIAEHFGKQAKEAS